jgi:hypothetical protein
LLGADLEACVVAPGFVAEVGDAGVVGRREYEGLFGEDWQDGSVSGGGDGVEKAWWRWMLKNWLPEQSRQWKGDSSASMVEPPLSWRIEVDDPQESLDNKEEWVPPSAMNGEKSRVKEYQEFFIADSTGRGNGVVVGEG